MNTKLSSVLCGVGLAMCSLNSAAGVMIDIYESGNNVVARFAGAINLNATEGLSVFSPIGTFGAISSGAGSITFLGNDAPPPANPLIGLVSLYETGQLATPFGTSAGFVYEAIDDPTGPFFGYTNYLGGSVYLPIDYVSGTFISGSTTFDGFSFASLGLTPGSYRTTFRNSDTGVSDFVNVQVPVPAPLFLLAVGMIALGRSRRHRS